MSIIGGQNTPTTNGLAYIIDFNNNYISGSSTVTPVLYFPTASQFTGSVPNLVNGQVQFTGSSVLRTFQTFPGFSAVQGNMTLMFSGESKNSNVLFTQDGTLAVVSTTSSIGYGVPAGNLGRNFPNVGFDHVTLRFSSASVDCFINGIPVSASGMFPTVPSSSTFTDFKIGGNYINAWTGSFSGSLGQLMVYNRVLTDDEIYSNYLIQARRYGLSEQAKPYTVDSSVYVYTQAAGITGSSTINALNTFVSGLKTAGLWDKMIAIYPFIGTSPSASRLNLKDVSLNTTQVNYSGSWSTSLSGSYNNNTASYGILSNITPTYVHPLINSQSIHLSYLSYDTPVSGGYLMGVEEIPGLPGDIVQPAAAYSVRKVRTAYTGSALRIRRDSDDLSFDVGFDASGNLDTGSLLTKMTASLNTPTLPGDYSGLAAAYSLRRISSSYSGYAVEVRKASTNASASIGFYSSGDLNTGSLLAFVQTGSEAPAGSYSGLVTAYSLRRVVPGYAGDAIEIQSGSVSQSIGFDSFGDLNITAIRTFAGSGDAFVKTWYDQSGNGYHATQSATSNQPKIYSGSQGSVILDNGKPALEFDGDSFSVSIPSPSTLGGFSHYLVASRISSSDVINTFGDGVASSIYAFSIFSGLGWLSRVGTAFQNFGNLNNTGQFLISINRKTSTTEMYLNNSVLGDLANTTLSTTNFTNFGSSAAASKGKFQEVLLFSSSQATNRTYIENNINSYYGIYTPSSVSTENAFVKTWYDQSGNNRHAVQAATSSQPQIVSSGVIVTENGKPAVNFPVNTALNISSVGLTATNPPVSMFMPIRLTELGTNIYNKYSSIIGVVGSGFPRYGFFATDNSLIGARNGSSTSTSDSFGTSSNLTSMFMASGIFSTSSVEVFYNNLTDGGTEITVEPTNITEQTHIGQLNNSQYAARFKTPELLIYTSSQVTASRTLIEDNINGYYNIFTQSLASGSGYVQTWYDQSGNNRHASQSVAANQPLILSSGSIVTEGGKPSLNFNGKILTTSFPYTSGTRYTSFQVVKQLAGAVLGATTNTGGAFYAVSDTLGSNSFSGFSNVSYYKNGSLISGVLRSSLYNVLLNEDVILTSFITNTSTANLTIGYPGYSNYNLKEKIVYALDQSSSRQPIEQNINNYFNIYNQPYNQNSNSLSLFSSPTVVAGGANAVPTGLTTGGPEGLITISRTGSGDYTLWKNRVPTKTSLPPSVPQSRSLYLNAANVSNAVFSASLNTAAYASVGAGLTDSEVYTYYELVDNLQTNLGRTKGSNPNAFITTWDTRISGTGTVSNTSSIVLPLFGTQAITASWGDGTVSLISSSTQVDRTHSYATPGVYTVSITGQGQGFQFNNGGDRNKLIDIGQWGSISGSVGSAFYGCANLIGTAADPQTISDLASYFRATGNFNGYINNWNTANASDMLYTFGDATKFNQPIGNWNVSNITRMSNAFLYASSFNQNLGAWNVEKVTEAARMFDSSPFNNGGSPSINNWRPISCSNFTSMFQSSVFNQPIGNWPLSASNINMANMFNNADAFNQNIGDWNVEKVINMGSMFAGTLLFNNSGSADINNWRPISCSNFSSMFQSATAFNQPIGDWTLGTGNEVPLGIDMNSMFYAASNFNQNIGSWNVSKVTSMFRMFRDGVSDFNNGGSPDINTWTPVSCSSFREMFLSNTAFNQPVEGWTLPTDRTYTMQDMFSGATSFNQPLGMWNIVSCSDMSGMLNNCGMDINNYSQTLIGWASQPASLIPRNITLGATGRQYNTPGSASRAILTSAPYSWTITGDTYVP